MRISDWSSDVCSSDLGAGKQHRHTRALRTERQVIGYLRTCHARQRSIPFIQKGVAAAQAAQLLPGLDQHRRKTQACQPNSAGYARRAAADDGRIVVFPEDASRSEEHTSELQSLMRISYAVLCLKKKKITNHAAYIDGCIKTNT